MRIKITSGEKSIPPKSGRMRRMGRYTGAVIRSIATARVRTPCELVLSTLNANSQLRITWPMMIQVTMVSRKSMMSTMAISMAEGLAGRSLGRKPLGLRFGEHDREVLVGVAPLGDRSPAAGEEQQARAALTIFVAVLDVDRRAPLECEVPAGDAEAEVTGSDKMDIDA